MKQKNSVFTKALSVLMTAVMLFTMMAVGIIIPDTKLEAQAATVGQTYTASSVGNINSYIASANTAGPNVITTIKLGANLDLGETAAFTTITGYVKFDFNGHYLKFKYENTGLGNNDNSNTEQQLPSDLQSSYTTAQAYDTVNKGFFNVGTAGTLNFVNTSGTAGSLEVRTYAYGDDGNAHHSATWNRVTTTWMTTSSAVRSEGTLILGDNTNSANNNFTILTQARSGTDSDGYDKRNMAANSYAVTIDNANAKFFMYGGSVKSLATCRTNYKGNSNARCFPININNCYSAEIYGGSAYIPGDDECGVRNSDGNASTGGTCYFASMRINTSNVYIFNIDSSVGIHVGDDTDKVNTSTANIYVPNTSALPCVYGGKFANSSSGVDKSSAGWDHNYTILGKFSYADSTVKPGTSKSQSVNGTDGWQYVYRSAVPTQYFYTMFYFATAETENGIYPWNYATFRDYVTARSSSDVYNSGYTYTRVNDGTNRSVDSDRKYRRNGYAYTAWSGTNMRGSTGSSTYASSSACGFNASNGGSMFLFPKWNLNTYTITYDLNDATGNCKASNASNAPATYNITSTSTLPTPTRTGYTFDKWEVTAKTVPDTDTQDPWYVGNSYSAGLSLTGKNGSISLKALWKENPYKVTFNYNNIPAGQSGTNTTSTADYTVNSSFSFPTGLTKPYYTFNNSWKVTTAAGSFASGSAYDAGSTSPNASYGNATFTAQYTPINYTITFDSDFGANVEAMTYNYESTSTLPATTRLGYTFAGWKPESVSSTGLWDPSTAYPAGTSLNHKHDNVTLKAQWESETATVTLSLAADEVIDGNKQLNYAYASPLVLNNPRKTGYTFKGWKVTQVPGDYTSAIPAANRWTMDKEYLLGGETNVTLPANMIGNVTLTPIWEANNYRLIYNTNGGSAVSPRDYKITDSFNLATPTRNGYTFAGWSVTAHDETYNWTAATYSANQAMSGRYGNVTLTANWTAKGYTVSLNVNGGDALVDNTLAYNTENATTLPVPTRTGFTFIGWKLTEAAADSDWSSYTGRPANDIYTDALPQGHYGNLTLTAQWVHQEYTITLNTSGSNGGTRNYHIDDAAFTLGSSEMSGYTFNSWKVNASAGNWVKDESYTALATITNKYGNVSLTAQFTPINYTVTYLDKDGSQWGDAVQYNIESTLNLSTYTAAGYTFGGWKVKSVSAGGGWSVGDEIPAGDLTAGIYYGNVVLEPVLTPVNYTISFIPNSGTAYPAKEYTIETDDYTLPGSTRTGYDFAGWKVTTAGGNWTAGAVLPAGTAVSGKYGSVTLTAQWTPKKYAVTYVVGDTTLYPSGITKEGTYGQTAPDLTAAEKAKPSDAQYDYTFDRWEPALGTVTGEATYTAVYTKTLRSYDITWMIPDDNGGVLGNYTAEVSTGIEYGTVPVYNDGVNPTLESDTPDDYSWRFLGWSTTEGGSVSSVPAVTGAATYYAVFEQVLAPQEVNWVINGVTNTEYWGIDSIPVWEHETPSKPDENGYKYVFSGWSPSVVKVEFNHTYTYTAQFTAQLQTYNYTFNPAGGEMTDAAAGTYKMGDTITFPAPVKTGYTFAGWKLDAAAGSWAADTTVSAGDYVTNTLWGEVSFTAQWTPVTYHITFAQGTAADVVPAALEYNIESTDVLPDASREGYDLSGWIISTGAGNWTQGSRVDAGYVLSGNYGNVTLTPLWQVKTYTIHWVSGGISQDVEVEYDGAIVAYPPSSKMGYTADWDAEVPATMPAHDLTFTAVYTPVEYYIRVNVNGGSAVENFYYTINGDNTLPTPTREGATFGGWKVTAASGNWSKNTLFEGGASLNGKYGNVTLTAQWNMRTCTVIWDAGDQIKTTVWFYGSIPSFDGTPYKSPDDENSYVFAGWDKEIVAVTEDEVTYTALFTPTEREYTINWNIDGAVTTETYHFGETPTFKGATPVRPSTSEYDFTFTGWSPAVDTVTKDVTYVAQFDVFTKIQGLSLDASAKFLEIGANEELKATIYPTTATVRDVIWTSLNPDAVTVDAGGHISAVNAGLSVIKVSSVDGSFSSYCVVTVNPKHTSVIKVTAGGVSTTQLSGSSIQLSATIEPADATNTGFTWTSSDNAVASVSASGLVTFNAVGFATITARAKDGFAVGSIVVRTTQNEEEIEDKDKTYTVGFASAGSKFIVVGPTGAEQSFKEITIIYPKGTDVKFRLENNAFNALINGVSAKPEADGYYYIRNIDKNYAIIDELFDLGLDDIDPNPDKNDAPTFFQRLQQFFRSIVEFFRNLFKR